MRTSKVRTVALAVAAAAMLGEIGAAQGRGTAPAEPALPYKLVEFPMPATSAVPP